ncbi:signal peptide protein [Rhodopirellula sp. SWK7]|nr:signal peptide protein [Rhodopirellula sp. SWK7]
MTKRLYPIADSAMSSAPIPWKYLRNILVLFAPLWVGSALLFGIGGLGIAVLSKDRWSARQPLVLRDEANGAVDRLGRFSSQTELKAAQETILELAQNPEVVAAALRQIGPVGGGNDPTYPSAREVDEIAKESVNVVAPQGREFGNTEVVYLTVEAETQERAGEFCRVLLDSLTSHLREVRRIRADSVIVELTHARDLARQKLDSALGRMREIELQVGSDLGELRNLNDTISGDGANRRSMQEIERELQTAELEMRRLDSLYQLLLAGSQNARTLLISGDELLSSQPSLQRLKDGLIDAQIEASRLASVYTTEHPRRRAAITTEREIEQRMLEEARGALRAMEPTLRLSTERVRRLREQHSDLGEKLTRLAGVRTGYSKLDSEIRALTDHLAGAEEALSKAQASRSAALSTNLLSELGPPQVGDTPEGMSGSMTTFGSMIAGLVFGLGTVFLVAPGPTGPTFGRRLGDYLTGRRSTDPGNHPPGQRPVEGAPPSGVERRRR